jgi:hypothetical protein
LCLRTLILEGMAIFRKLSQGFSSSATRGMSELDKEVETRMKHLDVFTDDFSPPGSGESFPGADFDKRDAPYGKPHDDFAPEADPSFWKKGSEGPWARQLPQKMAAAGDARDQQPMDDLDEVEYRFEAPVKKVEDQFPGIPKPDHNPYDEFPGDIDMEDHKQETRFDPHLTDPRLLKKGKVNDLASLNKEIEKRFKMVSGEIKSDNADIYDQRGKF